jgi:hypothetical protein
MDQYERIVLTVFQRHPLPRTSHMKPIWEVNRVAHRRLGYSALDIATANRNLFLRLWRRRPAEMMAGHLAEIRLPLLKLPFSPFNSIEDAVELARGRRPWPRVPQLLKESARRPSPGRLALLIGYLAERALSVALALGFAISLLAVASKGLLRRPLTDRDRLAICLGAFFLGLVGVHATVAIELRYFAPVQFCVPLLGVSAFLTLATSVRDLRRR